MTEVLLPTEIINKSNIMEDNEEKRDGKPAQKASTMQTWQRFVDFILRHLTQISIKYTNWEEDQYGYFCEALDFSEQIEGAALSLADLRKRAKLLKDEKAKSDRLNCDKYGVRLPNAIDTTPDPGPILAYLDLVARLREVSSVAADLQKSLKKADVSNIEDQVQIQKYWKAMTLPRIDLSIMTMKDSTAGPRAIWSALSRTIFYLSFQYLKKASVNSGIELKPDADLVSFNLTTEELDYAKSIVLAIDEQIQKQFSPTNQNDDLAARLSNMGKKEEIPIPEIIGMSDDHGITLPDEVPKEKPLKKKGKKGSKNRAPKSSTKGHHRKVK